ncbi:RagB/SusD family nutrient uptake outer membrane protein [Pedobacter gandavensis]|uniref:RagB/SusD family nutrient uptake outer membrane protein n=1 Tax=Pedobacter gandavensis TaxID=2679963 RepID=UPI00292FA096|nr:RagB/SusD family nutrient uptake outer membrane protein [Pedobacter gandavensis]
MMKNIKYIIIGLSCSVALFSGCKKFLNVVPIDNLTGNNYWQNKKDVEAFTSGLYQQFRAKVAGNDAKSFYLTFDVRNAPIEAIDKHLNILAAGNIRNLQKEEDWSISGDKQGGGYGYYNMTNWKKFYDIIQAANILTVQVDNIPTATFSENDKKRYRAEAVFMRNLSYLFMVRLYGDVPYYTEAYHTAPLARMPMVEVLEKCIADMKAVKEDLPWSYGDQSIVAIRATRGSALALLMHLNMWAAAFDSGKATAHYVETQKLGAELLANPGVYELLPLEKSKQIFKGRTKEGLFEVLQNSNYGEFFNVRSNLANLMTYYPYRGTIRETTNRAYYTTKYMESLYPTSGGPDKRLTTWFNKPFSGDASFQFLKFINVYGGEGTAVRNDDNIIVFRYADAILLAAEAAAETEDVGEAQRLVNMIRTRANASQITTTGSDLKDDIYRERCRELMGEGHYYNDLVRTKRIMNAKFNLSTVMSVSDFIQGAWTWPIYKDAMNNNPYMKLNDFWK